MADKPSYLGLLNAIAVGECRGHALLSCWAQTTKDEALSTTLKIVWLREQEHSAAFEKRMCELGFFKREKPSDEFEKNMKCMASAEISDRQKFEDVFGYGKERPDLLGDLFKDTSIDPVTGELLGRFIAEERASGRRLREAYTKTKMEKSMPDSTLEDISARLDRLTKTIEKLRGLRRGGWRAPSASG